MNFTKKYNQHIDNLDSLKARQIQLSKEMQLAYDYKEDLISKMQFADKQIKVKQKENETWWMALPNEPIHQARRSNSVINA